MRQALDKISTQILRFVPLFLSFLVPLFFLPVTVDYFAFNKFYLVAIIATVSLVSWCIRNLTRGKLNFTDSPALTPLVVLVLVNILSSVISSSTSHTSLFGQTSLFFSLVIIFMTVTSSQKNHFTVLSSIYGFIGSATLLSIFTLLHYFGLIAKLFPGSPYATDRFFNPTGSILPALAFTIPVMLATIVYTTRLKKWLFKSLLFASVLLMIASSVINLSLILPQGGQSVVSILPVSAGWSIAVDTMKTWKSALLGTGPETFLSAYSRLRPAFLNLDKNLWNIRFSESSNFLFTLITTTGLLGALAFVFSFARPIIVGFKSRRNLANHAEFSFLLTALTAIFVSFLVIPTGIVSLVSAVVLLISLVIELKLVENKAVKDITFSLSAKTSSASVYNDLPDSATTTVTSSFLPWFVTFIAVALLSTFWFFAGKIYLASMAYKQAVVISQADPYNAFLKFQKAAQIDTYNPYYPQKLSQIYLAIADAYLSKEKPTDDEKKAGTDFAQRALDAGKQSAKLDPLNVTTWENLFAVYKTLIPYAQGSADMAISHGLQVAAVEPTNPAIYLQLGTLLYNLGDTDQAVRFIDRARELKQNWDLPYLNLSSIYKAKKDYTKALQYAQAGVQYTDPKGENLTTIQEEIKNLEKLAPAPTATQSATVQ